jgi:hypothetical protein
MIVEINSKFRKADDEFVTANGTVVSITPPLDENYWLMRVVLKHDQAIVCFPKFGTIGCGFTQEEDWNTNFPIDKPAEEIYEHIEHNKKYGDITREECIAAICELQGIARTHYGIGLAAAPEVKP